MTQAIMNAGYQKILATLLIILLLVNAGALVYMANRPVEVQGITEAEFIGMLNAAIPENTDNPKIDAIYDEVFKEDNVEDIALNLALTELETKDVKKKIVSKLNSANEDVEDYKDLTNLTVLDSEVVVNGKKAEVTLEVKAYYFVDGDEDEEGRARFEVTFDVSGLDEDEDYADAEVSDFKTVLEKVYD